MKDTISSVPVHPLLGSLFQLLQALRPAFGQERVYQRALGLLLSELFTFARHTITQQLLTLGITDGDWSGFYRFYSCLRFREERAAQGLLQESLVHVVSSDPYVTAMDGTTLHRSSRKMPGTSWLHDRRFSSFRPGVHRAQRFLHGAWLTPTEDGYSRAIPLRFLPAFPPKAVPAHTPARREWEAGLVYLHWLRDGLDHFGRLAQSILALTDGSFDVVGLWRGLPERVILVTRTARNRVLYWLPQRSPHPGRGRPLSYGEPAPKPSQWLHAGLRHWPTAHIRVRGKTISIRYQVIGPLLRDGCPERPLFLIVVKGKHYTVGQKKPAIKQLRPAFYLVSAVQQEAAWLLPMPIETILTWLWQRWEMEVAHRELKSGLGLGEKQCWNVRSVEANVQWSAWVYAVLVLAGYRTWGLLGGPPTPARWWGGSGRWSLSTLWRAYRAALWGNQEFRTLWTGTGNNWLKKDTWLAGLTNSVAAAARI